MVGGVPGARIRMRQKNAENTGITGDGSALQHPGIAMRMAGFSEANCIHDYRQFSKESIKIPGKVKLP